MISDEMCPHVPWIYLLILAALAPPLVFSEAAGQSATLRETATSRTLSAMNLAEACRDPKYHRIRRACNVSAVQAVTAFVGQPHPNTVPSRVAIDTALDALLAALAADSAEIVVLDSRLVELRSRLSGLDAGTAAPDTVLSVLATAFKEFAPALKEFEPVLREFEAVPAEFETVPAEFETVPAEFETVVAEFGMALGELRHLPSLTADHKPNFADIEGILTRLGVDIAFAPGDAGSVTGGRVREVVSSAVETGIRVLETGSTQIQAVSAEIARVTAGIHQGPYATAATRLETETVSMTRLSLPSAVVAVTDFLISRAKAELVQSAFQEAAVAFGDQGSTLYKLLPSTRNVLDAADQLSYRVLMPTFRAAVKEDFKALPRNIATDLAIYRNSGMNEAQIPDRVRLLSVVGDAFMRLESGADVLTILSDLNGLQGEWKEKDLQWGLQFFSQFAKEFRARRGHTGPNPNESLLDWLLSDRKAATAFVADLLSRLPSPPNDEFVAHVNEHLPDVRELAAELYRLVNLRHPGTSASDGQVTPDRASVVHQIATVFQTVVPLLARDTTVQGLRAETQMWREQIRLAHSLWTAIEGRDYHRIVALMVDRLPALRTDSLQAVRMLSFAASVASADGAEDLGEALEALADPVGSFRSRRLRNAWGLSLVSYVGIGRGNEQITDLADSGVNYLGAFAPIGIEASWGTGWWLIGSIGIMGSLVDLGTLVRYRYEETDTMPEVHLQDVFSPAVSLVFGVTPYPVSIGFTRQFSTRQRTLKGAEEQLSADRTSFFLAIDLTLLRF